MDGNCDALLVERKQKQGRLRIMAELRVRIHIRTSAVSRSQGTMISELERVIWESPERNHSSVMASDYDCRIPW